MKKKEKKKGWALSWLKRFIAFRWFVFIVSIIVNNVPYLNSWRIKAGNVAGNILGDVPQSLLSGLQNLLQETMPTVFSFGAEHWNQIQSLAIWFWNALLIQIPALLIVLFLLWQFGRQIRNASTSAAAWTRRHSAGLAEGLRELKPRLAKEEHLILRAVVAEKESVYDIGAQRNVRLTGNVSVSIIEGKPYVLFSNGKKRPLKNSYWEEGLFVEIITVPI